ncbi:MAG: efflux RND transporter permease subunit, partial [Candidatus Omnitrophota bacterium]
IASIIVAISLVPVLTLICGESKRDERISEKVEFYTEEYTTKFESWLRKIMHHKPLIIGSVAALFALSMLVLFSLNREFMPRVDQRQFIIKVDLAPGTRLEITDKVARKLERAILVLPELKDCTVNIGASEEKDSPEKSALQTLGSHQAQVMVNLRKKSLGAKRSTDEVIQHLKSVFDNTPLENAELEYIAQETSLGSAVEQGAPVVIEVKGPDLNKLVGYASLIQTQLKNIRGLYGIKTTLAKPSPETKLNILKDKASLYGLSVRDIAVTTQVALKGYVATKFKEKNVEEDVDIRVRLRPQDRNDFGTLRRLLIHSPTGADVAMSDLAYLAKGRGPTEIKRIDQQRGIVVTANIYKRNFADVARDINRRVAALRKSHIPMEYNIDLTGEQQKMKESFSSLAFALIMAILLVYMIMAAEFESLWQPLLIMFTVPLSLIGVAFCLFITHTSLSVVAYLGIIMLGGISVNNGIVLIELVNTLRKEGYSAEEAVLAASKTRLRPILMTSLTTILGLVPLALGIGEGAELQSPLALTVLGGLTSSTFLTLVFIPALYVLIENKISAIPFFRKTDRLAQTQEGPAAATVEILGIQTRPDADQENEKRIEDIQRTLREKEAALQSLQQQIQNQQTAVALQASDKEMLLAALKRQLKEKESALESLRTEMLATKAEIGSLSSEKEKDVQTKISQLADEEKRLQLLSQQIAAEQQKYQQAAEEKTKQLSDYRIQLSEKETSLGEMQQQIQKQKRDLEAFVEQKNKELEEHEKKKDLKARHEPPQELNPRQLALIDKLKTTERITRKEYSDMLNISTPTAARDLKELLDKKILAAKGPLGPGRWYELNK